MGSIDSSNINKPFFLPDGVDGVVSSVQNAATAIQDGVNLAAYTADLVARAGQCLYNRGLLECAKKATIILAEELSKKIAKISVSKEVSDWTYSGLSNASSGIWYLGDKISYLPDMVINKASSALGLSFQSDLHQRIHDFASTIYDYKYMVIDHKVKLVEGDRVYSADAVHLPELLVPGLAFWFSSRRMNKNIAGVLRSISILANSIVTGKLTYQSNLTSLSGCKQVNGCHATATYMRKYTYSGLIKDIFVESGFAGLWFVPTYITRQGIINALDKADKQYGQYASMLSMALIAYPVFAYLLQKAARAIASKQHDDNRTSQFTSDGNNKFVSEVPEPSYTDDSIAQLAKDIEEARQHIGAKEQPENDELV